MQRKPIENSPTQGLLLEIVLISKRGTEGTISKKGNIFFFIISILDAKKQEIFLPKIFDLKF